MKRNYLGAGNLKELRESLAKEIPQECISAVEKLLSICIMDPYLEIPNRLYFEVFGKREIELSRRLGVPLCILFIDVDNLKKINDTYGHLAGDLYLKNIVKIIRGTLRESDLLVRWGGDEFIVLLYNTDATGAVLVKERVENAVNSTVFLIGSREFRGRVSIGWAEVCDSLTSAITIADARMYEEKRRKGCGRAGV